MRRLFLAIVLLAFGINQCKAQDWVNCDHNFTPYMNYVDVIMEIEKDFVPEMEELFVGEEETGDENVIIYQWGDHFTSFVFNDNDELIEIEDEYDGYTVDYEHELFFVSWLKGVDADFIGPLNCNEYRERK